MSEKSSLKRVDNVKGKLKNIFGQRWWRLWVILIVVLAAFGIKLLMEPYDKSNRSDESFSSADTAISYTGDLASDEETKSIEALSEEEMLMEGLDKKADESISYAYDSSPKNIVLDSIYYGDFTHEGKEQVLAIFKLLNMPHAGGLDCSVAAVYDRNTLKIISQKTFGMDACSFRILKDDFGKSYLLFAGSTTYQGYSNFTLGVWKADKEWKQIFPENPNVYSNTTKKLEFKNGDRVSVWRPVFIADSGELLSRTEWIYEYDLKWNEKTKIMEKIIPQTYTGPNGQVDIGEVSKSPDEKYAISTYIEEFEGEYKVFLYDTVKNVLLDSFDILSKEHGFLWSPDSGMISVTQTARTWQGISIIDVRTGNVVVVENIYDNLKAQGIKLDYSLHEYRPDPVLTPVEWTADSKKLLISYKWRDSKDFMQSGSFLFDVKSGHLSEVVENPPAIEG